MTQVKADAGSLTLVKYSFPSPTMNSTLVLANALRTRGSGIVELHCACSDGLDEGDNIFGRREVVCYLAVVDAHCSGHCRKQDTFTKSHRENEYILQKNKKKLTELVCFSLKSE